MECGRDMQMAGLWLAGFGWCGLHCAKGTLKGLFKDIHYTEVLSTDRLLVPSELVLADTGTDCRAHTCTHKSKQGDFPSPASCW